MIERISLGEWDARYPALKAAGLEEPSCGGPLGRHLDAGDRRLATLRYDPSAAALRLWNFLLSEEDRLHAARAAGQKIVGTMKDLGTVPVMAYALPNLTAFYPDGAWWIPCVMERGSGALAAADQLGVPESFCPVRAMLGAFATGAHFPIPDLLVSSAGSVCDDFSAIAQRVEGLGHPVLWWEMPHRRMPDDGEEAVALPGGLAAPAAQVAIVRTELARVGRALESLSGHRLDAAALAEGIRRANEVRAVLRMLREAVFTAPAAPLPALELQIAEMLAIHFCSDRAESLAVLTGLRDEVARRVRAGEGCAPADAVRVFWINPVADIRALNLLEDCGARLCGTDFMIGHALDPIPEDVPPLEALARMALSDPMVGCSGERAQRAGREMRALGAEAAVVSRIPGASHCATEGAILRDTIGGICDVPVVEIEVPPLSDAMLPNVRTRLEALAETVRRRRGR